MLKIVLCLCVAMAAAIPLHYDQEQQYASKYTYKYEVVDPHTADIKSQWESRDGHRVRGSYRLVEPDGTVRIVEYTADPHEGFRAVVTREKHGHREVTVHGKQEEGVQQTEGYYGGYEGQIGAGYNTGIEGGYYGGERPVVGGGYSGVSYYPQNQYYASAIAGR